MVSNSWYNTNDEKGFILIVSLMMLVILSLVGSFALNTTIFELQISGNDKVAKDSFYRADAGGQAGSELLEQNLGCPNGFSANPPFAIQGVNVYDAKMAYHEVLTDVNGVTTWVAAEGRPVTLEDIPNDTIRAARILNDPGSGNDTTPHTNIVAWGNTEYLPGSALQMAAGYEGRAKGAAGTGAVIKYELQSQHLGLANSEARIAANWFHTIGQEGDCSY